MPQMLSIAVDGWCGGSASALATLSGDTRERTWSWGRKTEP